MLNSLLSKTTPWISAAITGRTRTRSIMPCGRVRPAIRLWTRS